MYKTFDFYSFVDSNSNIFNRKCLLRKELFTCGIFLGVVSLARRNTRKGEIQREFRRGASTFLNLCNRRRVRFNSVTRIIASRQVFPFLHFHSLSP